MEGEAQTRAREHAYYKESAGRYALGALQPCILFIDNVKGLSYVEPVGAIKRRNATERAAQ